MEGKTRSTTSFQADCSIEKDEKDENSIRTFVIVLSLIAQASAIKKLVQKIVKEYLKTRKNPPRELILKIVDRIEIHQDKTVDLYFKLK